MPKNTVVRLGMSMGRGKYKGATGPAGKGRAERGAGHDLTGQDSVGQGSAGQGSASSCKHTESLSRQISRDTLDSLRLLAFAGERIHEKIANGNEKP